MPRPNRPILHRLTRLDGEAGDVPGWVLITAMTVALTICFNTPTFSTVGVRDAARALPADQLRPRRPIT
jgi:hypothetical protein